MALIDEIIENKTTEVEKKECNICKKDLSNENLQLNLCENCFNKEMENTLVNIVHNINQIDEKLTSMYKIAKQIQKVLEDEKLNIIIKNKANIDLINAEATIAKLKIDKQANEKAYIINQEQSNVFREMNKWAIHKIKSLKTKDNK